MKYNKWGLHLQGGQTDPNPALDTGVSNFVVLNGDIGSLDNGLARRLRDGLKARGRDGIILIRDYHENIMSQDPRERAKYVAEYMTDLYEAGISDHIVVGNELNLALEHKQGIEHQWYWESAEGYRLINEWVGQNIQELKAQIPWAIIHWPALAAGHGEDIQWNLNVDTDYMGYEICKDSILLADVMGVHDYPEPGDMSIDSPMIWWRAWRFARAIRYKNDREGWQHAEDPGGIMYWPWMTKPIFIKECSGFRNFDNLQAPYMKLIEYWAQVIGVGMWIWQTPDQQHKAGEIIGHPGEQGITNSPKKLFDMPTFDEEPEPEEPDPPEEEEEENTMPEFRLGFKTYADAHPDEVGEPLSQEYYEFKESGIPNEPVKITLQDTTTGTLKYFGDSNRVKFVPDPKA